jgi:hypothetical protein
MLRHTVNIHIFTYSHLDACKSSHRRPDVGLCAGPVGCGSLGVFLFQKSGHNVMMMTGHYLVIMHLYSFIDL